MPRTSTAAGLAAGMIVVLTAACSGSGGGSPQEQRSVSLRANTQLTPWRSGGLDLEVSPALAGTESMWCSIDDAQEQECRVDSRTGRVEYVNLVLGEHRLAVRTGPPGDTRTQTLKWRIASPAVVVYGSTPAGITAAIAAAKGGRDVVLIEPGRWLGGMVAGGLSKTDASGGESIGGLTKTFFERVRAREEAIGACSSDHPCPARFDVSPGVAKEVFTSMLAEQPRISLQRELAVGSVQREGNRIVSVTTSRGSIDGSVFIDATYAGDLMALAGVSHVSGREARQSGGADPGLVEDDAGTGPFVRPYAVTVDPFIVPGQPDSGLLPFVEIQPDVFPPLGSADDRVMAYNYRLCVTDDPGNRVPFTRPADYDPSRYEGSGRVALAIAARGNPPLDELYFNPAQTVRSTNPDYFKRDLNGGSVFSTDMSMPGWNQAYTTADAATRSAIARQYRSYIQGLLYFWQTDPRFGALNAKVASFGLCKDEFTDNDHWPYQLYARETRRMLGEYVMNENDVLRNGRRPAIADSVGMANYSMDSHVRRITWRQLSVNQGPLEYTVVSEGFRIVRGPEEKPYPVSYRSLLPRRTEAMNLLNPVTLSSTAMAYSSLRMEPTFMILGESAGTAAALSLETGADLHDLDIPTLKSRLHQSGQILD
ncbi:FAD-dependent oxidoreductase [Ideonella sp. YS5]|uniref:FAD-dependent oxidoreductase n=1 Tax=Ideonella sp. YS5 TaxID=3453714 RepID=UPI003EEDAC4B